MRAQGFDSVWSVDDERVRSTAAMDPLPAPRGPQRPREHPRARARETPADIAAHQRLDRGARVRAHRAHSAAAPCARARLRTPPAERNEPSSGSSTSNEMPNDVEIARASVRVLSDLYLERHHPLPESVDKGQRECCAQAMNVSVSRICCTERRVELGLGHPFGTSGSVSTMSRPANPGRKTAFVVVRRLQCRHGSARSRHESTPAVVGRMTAPCATTAPIRLRVSSGAREQTCRRVRYGLSSGSYRGNPSTMTGAG